MSRLHVVFGDSAAGTLRQALTGTTDRVISLSDDLSWGPIGVDRMTERIDYFEVNCPIPGGWSWLAGAHRDFWTDIAGSREERLIWLGSNSPSEMAAYLAYLDRFGDDPAEVVRPDDYLAPHPVYGPAGSVGVLNADDLADVLEQAKPRPVSDDSELFGRWAILVGEGARLRVLDNGRLESASFDHFDPLILDAVPAEWKPAVRVVGDAMAAAFEARIQVNSDFLFSRLSHLAKTAAVEADADVLAWTENRRRSPAHVRRPS